jgi:T5SS/PEP-CTERM-associated repeat protein
MADFQRYSYDVTVLLATESGSSHFFRDATSDEIHHRALVAIVFGGVMFGRQSFQNYSRCSIFAIMAARRYRLSPMGIRTVHSLSAIVVCAFGWPIPTSATDFFWNRPDGGAFGDPTAWAPLGGPGGPGDSVFFDLGSPVVARYIVNEVSGQNDRLAIHKDTLELRVTNYSLLHNPIDGVASFIVGVDSCDVADVFLAGDANAAFQTRDATIANDPGSVGILQVEDLNWSAGGNLIVGYGGSGSLTFRGAGLLATATGYIAGSPGSFGKVTLDGASASWNASGSALFTGYAGDGELWILNGASLSSLSSTIGFAVDSTGLVVVEGSGSNWNNWFSNLNIGGSGSGVLLISGGGSVTSTVATIGDHGHGLVSVNNSGSVWTSSGEIRVGNFGSGQLSIESGGLVSSANGIIARQPGSSGLVTVEGNGSRWNTAVILDVGASGIGTLNIQDGANVTSIYGRVGVMTGSLGSVNVDGIGSSWTNSDVLAVGVSGAGKMTISRGAAVVSRAGSIGTFAGSSGAVVIDGNNSRWILSGELGIGGSGFATAVGMATVGSGALLSADGPISINQWGTLRLAGGIVAANGGLASAGGTLTGHGQIVGNVTNQGIVAPGDHVGTMQIDGNYSQLPNGVLSIQVGGLAPGIGHDLLEVSDAATLNGQLQISFINGFVPPLGSKISFLTANSLVGRLSLADGFELPANYDVRLVTFPTYSAILFLKDTCSSIQCPFSESGDLNNDGRFDESDIPAFALALRDPVGYSLLYGSDLRLYGDYDNNGRLDFGDIGGFVAGLAGSGGLSQEYILAAFAAQLRVPEPSTFMAASLGCCLLALTRLRRQH